MAAIVRANFPQALLPFVGDWAGQAFKEQEPVYAKVFETFNMDHAYQTDVMNYGASLMAQVGENQPFEFDTMAQTWQYTYTALKYVSGFLISEEEQEDSKHMDITKLRTKETTKAINATRETIASTILNNAFSSSYTYGDSVALISNAHVIGRGPNQSNRPSAYTDLSETALEQAIIDIKDIRDETGIRMQLKVKKLLVPKESVFEAHRILKSTLQYNTAENNANALADMNLIPEILSWNYLTDTDAWFLLLDSPFGLRYGVRRKQKLEGDNDFLTSAARFKFSFREVAGATNTLRCIYGSQGA